MPTTVTFNMMYRITLSFFIFALLSCETHTNAITKVKVLALFTEIKALYLAGNVDEMMNYYTDDIIVIANITRPTAVQGATVNMSLKFSKEKYRALVESVNDKATAHSYDVENLNIIIGDDVASSSASYNATEKFEMDGETIVTKSFVEISFTMSEEGKLLISAMSVTEE